MASILGEHTTEERLEILDSVLDSARLGIWDWNPQTNDVVFNREWKRMLGYAPDELPDRLQSWERLIHPDDKADTYRVLQEHMDGKTSFYESRHRLKHKEGHWMWILDTGRVVKRDDQDRPVRVTGIHQDITATVDMQETLRKERDRAVRAEKAKQQFLAHMSHEIRTPMHGVFGIAQILQQAQPSEWVDMIAESASHMIRVVNDILDVSKWEHESFVPDWQENVPLVNIHKAIGSTFAKHVSKTEEADEKTAMPVLQTIASLRVVHKGPWQKRGLVKTDPTRLTQVILNLVNNAIKFTPSYGSVTLTYDTSDPKLLRILVEDTGCGMTEEQLSRVFKPFEQADVSTARFYGGTGLGLTISKRIIEALGGTLACVSSEAGVGSCFEVDLPVTYMDIASTPLASPMRVTRNYQKHALVADDHPINTRIMVRMLKGLGITSTCVTDGKALVELRNTPHDIMITDWHMPILTGLEAATQLRTKFGFKGPIVCSTASSMQEETQMCLRAGCDAVLSKPFRVEELVKILDEVFSV